MYGTFDLFYSICLRKIPPKKLKLKRQYVSRIPPKRFSLAKNFSLTRIQLSFEPNNLIRLVLRFRHVFFPLRIDLISFLRLNLACAFFHHTLRLLPFAVVINN